MTVIRPRYLAVAVATGLVLTAAAGGVGYAAGSTASNVSACVSSKGRLAVQNSKGKCPKKYKKVSIAKQGPRGATGATGKTGPQGPGAAALVNSYLFAGTGTPVTVGGVTYASSCDVSGTGSSRVVVTHLSITGQTGKSVSLRGISSFGSPSDGSSAATTTVAQSNSSKIDHTLLANNNQSGSEWLTGALVQSGTAVQTVTMHLQSNPNDGVFPFLPTRCLLEGTITPAA